MKLCRFELTQVPGKLRSGFYYGGKVYETDGANAVAVHDFQQVRFLSPIGAPPAIRYVQIRNTGFSEWSESSESESGSADFAMSYLNASVLVGPNMRIRHPYPDEVRVKPCLAVVLANPGENLSWEDADGIVLGYMPAMVFYYAGLSQRETDRGVGIGRSHDIAITVGPALTTPDELDECLQDTPSGRHYELEFSLQLNRQMVSAFSTEATDWTPADVISYASKTSILKSGDLILIDLGQVAHEEGFEADDEISLVCDRLGSLSAKME